MSEVVTEYGVRYGDGEVDDQPNEQAARERIEMLRKLIADNALSFYTADTYEPMTVVCRQIPVLTPSRWVSVDAGDLA